MEPYLRRFTSILYICALFVAPSRTIAERAALSTVHNTVDEKRNAPYQSDIGAVCISIIGTRALDEVINDLQPRFELTASNALLEAVPNTLNSSETSVSSVNTTLQLAWMLGLANPTNASTSSRSSGPLTNLLASALSVQPISKYQAAASLLEQVRLLNRALEDVPRFKGYTPYIITLQISLIPYKRDAPYDAYATLGFFTDTNEFPQPPGLKTETIPVIYPLITTDALEMANDQQSLDVLRQLTLSIAAMVHNVGVSASRNSLNESLNAVTGYNLNSLLTVGKISQNCMVVRLGARNQIASKDRFTMVPETHNISLLILAKTDAKELEMTARTTFRNALDGSEAQDMAHQKRNEIFIKYVLGSYLLQENDADRLKRELREKPFGDLDTAFYNYIWTLINDVYDTNGNDHVTFTTFQSHFASFFTNATFTNFFDGKRHRYSGGKSGAMPQYSRFYTNVFDVVWLDSLWLDVTCLGMAEQYANDLVPLHPWIPPLPFKDQVVLYHTNEESITFTLINDGTPMLTDKMWAKLAVTTKTANSNAVSYSVFSHNLKVDGNGSLEIKFPAFSNIKNSGFETNLEVKQLQIIYGRENSNIASTNSYDHFAILNGINKAERVLPWKILRTYGILMAGATNDFGIVLACSSHSGTNTNYLDVANAIVIATNNPNGILMKRENGMYQLNGASGTGEVTFTLRPLSVGQAVDFNLWNDKGELVANLSHQPVYPSGSSQTGAPK